MLMDSPLYFGLAFQGIIFRLIYYSSEAAVAYLVAWKADLNA
jgi:hypothetical protein